MPPISSGVEGFDVQGHGSRFSGCRHGRGRGRWMALTMFM